MKLVKLIPVLFLVIAAAGVGAQAAKAGGKIVVYSPHGQEILEWYANKFQKETGIAMEWLFLGAQECYDRIKSEKANAQADVFFGGPTSSFIQAKGEGLLQAYKPSWDAKISAGFKDKDSFWYGNWQTPVVIMYNNRLLTADKAPKSWKELADPKWKDQLIIRYPLASGSMRSLYSALIYQEYKKSKSPQAAYDFLKKLDANTKEYSNQSTVMFQSIAKGEGLVSTWALPDIQTQISKNMPFSIVMPSDGSPVITDCLGIVAGAKNLAGAKAFVEFINSVDNAVEQATKFNRMPTRADALDRCPAWMKDPVKAMDVDWTVLAEKQGEWLKYWEENIRGAEKVK